MTIQTTDSVELEQARESLRKDVALAEDLAGLKNDERFIRLIMTNFCKEIVEEQTNQLISANEIIRDGALEKIKAAKFLEAYMDYVTDCGNAAKAELLEGEFNGN
jgi:hypothetical protein